MVSQNRADMAVTGARMDALIETITQATVRTEARMSLMEEKIDVTEVRVNSIEQLVQHLGAANYKGWRTTND